MAFDREQPRTAVIIRDIGVDLVDALNNNEHAYTARFSVQVVMSDGSVVTRRGDLLPHITAAQRNGLLSFMQALRTQAETELL